MKVRFTFRELGVALLLSLGGTLAGCQTEYVSEAPVISPNGAFLARLSSDMTHSDLAMAGYLASYCKSWRPEWFNVTEPTRLRHARLHWDSGVLALAQGREDWEYENWQDVKFSPDSRHVAVLSTFRLMVVNMNTGRTRRIAHVGLRSRWRAKLLVSMAWLSDEEICYALQTAPIKGGRAVTFKWTLLRRNVIDRWSKPRVVVEVEGPPSQAGWPPDYHFNIVRWAPNGRYALFTWPHANGHLMLVDVLTGTQHALRRGREALRQVAWRRDGSAALCQLWDLDSSPVSWVLVYPLQRRALDLTRQSQGVYRNQGALGAHLVLEPMWTVDGQFVLANDMTTMTESRVNQAYLIRPDPWEAISVNELLKDRPQGHHPSGVSVLPSGLRGWVRGRVGQRIYLIDYAGNYLIEVPSGLLTPTGKQVVTWEEAPKRHLEVHPLKLPNAPARAEVEFREVPELPITRIRKLMSRREG